MRSAEHMWGAEPEWVPEQTVEIPMCGVVAAGEPYRAFELDETLSVPAGIWEQQRVFALRVRGSSMVDEGIRDGDYLIVEPRETARDGQTVVAEIDGCVTVKKLYRDPGGHIRLQPANRELLPLIVRGDHVRVCGVVVGVLRKYGFTRQPPRPKPAAKPQPAPAGTQLAVNALDAQLESWRAVLAAARQQSRLRPRLPAMEALGRDLESLRDWCARTTKPTLRRALFAEANRIMRKMGKLRREV